MGQNFAFSMLKSTPAQKKCTTEKACFMKTSGILQLLSRSSTYIDNLGENLGDLFISKLETLYFNNS